MLRKIHGFTLLELLVFIVVIGILMNTLLLNAITGLRASASIRRQWVAVEAARGCMEWFLGQRRYVGFASLACPSTPSTASCNMPSGYTATANITCTTWNSDTTYKTITVNVAGLASASLSTQIGSY